MAYCDHQNVTGKTGHDYSQSSHPNRQEVEDVCEEISLEIDGNLRAAEYELPITNSDALKLLKRYATLGAAYSAWYAAVEQDSEPAHVASWKEDYQAFLKRIKTGAQVLPGKKPAATPGGMAAVGMRRQDGYAARAQRGEYG